MRLSIVCMVSFALSATVMACTYERLEPGEPSIEMEGAWTQGVLSQVKLRWENLGACDGVEGCVPGPPPTVTIQSITSRGCRFIDPVTRTGFVDSTSLAAIAETDGPVTV